MIDPPSLFNPPLSSHHSQSSLLSLIPLPLSMELWDEMIQREGTKDVPPPLLQDGMNGMNEMFGVLWFCCLLFIAIETIS